MEVVKLAIQEKQNTKDIVPGLIGKFELEKHLDLKINEIIVNTEKIFKNHNTKIIKIKTNLDKYVLKINYNNNNNNNLKAEFSSMKTIYNMFYDKIIFPKPIKYSRTDECETIQMKFLDISSIKYILNSKMNVYIYKTIDFLKLMKKRYNNITYSNQIVSKTINDILQAKDFFNEKEKLKLLNVKEYAELKNITAPIGYVYEDLDPNNISLNSSDSIVLLDPPQILIPQIVYWDIATYMVGMKKELFKIKDIKGVLGFKKLEIKTLCKYTEELDINYNNDFSLLYNLVKLQRLCQFYVFQYYSNKSAFSKKINMQYLRYEKKLIFKALRKVNYE